MSSPDDTAGARADVVVVGASVAGVRTVEALRQIGFGGSVLLVGDEPELPYDRPPLSKQFLAGDWGHERVRLLAAERAAELDVGLRLGSAATALDPAAHRLTLADGTVIGYCALVVATGASARPGPWPASPRLHILRSLGHSTRLRSALTGGRRVVIVGGGWIGAEVAATASARGCDVTVVDVVANPYARSLGDELGSVLCSIHERHGVSARLGSGVAAISDKGPHATVELADGTVLGADAVVVGIGATPNTAWLAGSGVPVDDGVVCDEFGRVEGVADAWAVGDVARWGSHRHEHWTSAVEQARAVAHNIAAPDDLVGSAGDGYVWSDQYDWKIQIVGTTGAGLACEVIGSADDTPMRIAGLYRDGYGRLVGAATVNWPKAFLLCRRSIGAADAHEQGALLRGLLDGIPARTQA